MTQRSLSILAGCMIGIVILLIGIERFGVIEKDDVIAIAFIMTVILAVLFITHDARQVAWGTFTLGESPWYVLRHARALFLALLILISVGYTVIARLLNRDQTTIEAPAGISDDPV